MLAVSARQETAPCEVITDSGATDMHALSLHLSAMQGWRMAWAGGGTRAWTLPSLRSSLCWVVLMSCRRDDSKTLHHTGGGTSLCPAKQGGCGG